jgi:hypothetical protein
MSIFAHRKRSFLSSILTGHTSYILTEVESSRGGEYKWGHNMLTIADCRRRIQLEFELGTPKARRQSLRKIDLLLTTLVRFGHALMTESQAIEKFEKKPKETKNGRIQKSRKRKPSKRVQKTSQEANG